MLLFVEVGGRLNSLGKFPFMSRGEVQNFNEALADGPYLIGDYGHKLPGNPGIEYGILLVFNAVGASETYKLQQAFNIYPPHIAYWRCFAGETGEGVEWNSY